MSEFKPHYQQGRKPEAAALPLFTITCILVILAMYAVAHVWDEKARLEDQIIDAQVRHATQSAQAEHEWAMKVARAYQQGQRDAMRNLRPADHVALAQTCQAWIHRHDADEDGTAMAGAPIGGNNSAGG